MAIEKPPENTLIAKGQNTPSEKPLIADVFLEGVFYLSCLVGM